MDKLIQLKIHLPSGIQKATMPEGTFSVGRSDMADFKIENDQLSRKHLSVKSHNGHLFVSDLGTTNGSFLNDRKLVANQWYEITEDDKIKLGLSEIYLQLSLIDDNVVDFAAKKEDATRPIKVPNSLRGPSPNAGSNLAVDFERTQIVQQEQNLDRQIEDIQARVQDIAKPQLSEVEMLQIKKLEIESKVAAIKIKEDAEILAKKLVDDANYKAKNIEADSLKKIQDKTKQINALKENINELNNKLYNLNEELQGSKNELALLQDTNNDLVAEIESNQQQLSDLHDQYASLEEKIQFEQESHNIIIQKKIADAKSLEEDKENIQEEIDQCIQQKEEIEYLIEQCKEREQAAQENYHKTQQRVDKIYKKRDELASEVSSLKEEIKSLSDKKLELDQELKNYRSQMEQEISEFEQKIQAKETHLENLEQQIQNDFKEQRDQLLDELNQLEKENEDKKSILVAERQEIAQKIIDEANDNAKLIIDEAKEIAQKLEDDTNAKILEFQSNQNQAFKELEEKKELLDKREVNLDVELKELRELTEKELKDLREQTHQEIKEQKEKTQLEVLKLQQDAKKEAQVKIDKAVHEYEATLVRAKEKAEQMVAKAKEEAKEFFDAGKEEFEKAQAKSNELLQSAQDKVVQINKDGLKELDEEKRYLEAQNKEREAKLKELDQSIVITQDELEQLKQSLDVERQKLRDEIKDEKERTIASAKAEAQKIKQACDNERAQVVAELEQQKQQSLKETKAEIERMQKAEEIKFQTQLREEKNMLTKMRAKEIESLKQMREKEEAAIAKAKKENAIQIAQGVETLVNLKLKKLAAHAQVKVNISVESENIRKLVFNSLSDKKAQDKAFFSMLNPYGAFGQGKSTQLMKRLAIGAGIIVLLVAVHFIFPKFYSGIYKSVASVIKVENSAKDLYLEDVKERRKNKPKFDPETSPEFKSEGLAANVLYTDNFADIWLSDRFQTSWSIKVDEIIVYKLQLPDERVVQYVAQEFKTIRSLQNLRDNIKPETEEEQIEQLKMLEKQGLINLKNILDGDENLAILQKEQEKFFNKFKK